ncbi:MAG: 3-oxoadipyl-CoA thiolase [Rhodospirillales bacterium]|nr:3-oxoadipyl-CoA thiolase [Rhodospirillales bacterium]HJO97160.1 3-oxoadipyl-CoA thiolase [Rhodospirillales bacterium]
MDNAYLYGGIRTPIGRHSGCLAGVRPDDLMGDTIATLLERIPFPGADVEDVIIGCCNQAGEDSRNVARRAALLAGLPVEVAGVTVHRQCGSGLNAVLDAARSAELGMGEVFVAGGVESMSRGPFVMAKAEKAFSPRVKVHDSSRGSRFPNRKIVKQFGDHEMPETAEIVGREHGIGRDESDAFALASQIKYAAAKADGFYADELFPVAVPGAKRGETRTIEEDEHPRPDSSPEGLAKLKPIYDDGVVTAGNASGINDGACALMVGTKEAGDRAGGIKPLARVVAGAVAGVEPRVMGLGPVPATKKVLERAGLTLADMDVIEINEAFATQVLGCLKLMDLEADDSRLNPNGGAIAIGHPLGASGARLTLTALNQLHRSDGRYALVTLCVGVGQGIAAVLEKV